MKKIIRSDGCYLLLKHEEGWKRLEKLFFLRDNSVCLAFPEIKGGGILAESHCSRDIAGIQQIDLKKSGKVTKEVVKFTYHSDGVAHFSKDGKIYTKIKISTLPLNNNGMHLFSCVYVDSSLLPDIKVRDYERYSEASVVRFFSNGAPKTLTLQCFCYTSHKVDIKEYSNSNYALLMSKNQKRIIKVTQGSSSKMSPENTRQEPVFIFMGGFKKENNAIRFLPALYPADYSSLKGGIGTIDLHSNI